MTSVAVTVRAPHLTLAAAQALVSDPGSAPPADVAAARTRLRTVRDPVRLDPTTGAPVAPPPAITALAIAPTSSPAAAFATFKVTQNALRLGARLAQATLPPHVIIPGVGRWTYIYLPAVDNHALTRLLAHTRLVYEDFQVLTDRLVDIAKNLAPSPASDLVRRLSLESHRLMRRSTATSISLRLRTALSEAPKMSARTVYAALTTKAPITTGTALRPASHAANLPTAPQGPTLLPYVEMRSLDPDGPTAACAVSPDQPKTAAPPSMVGDDDVAVLPVASPAARESAQPNALIPTPLSLNQLPHTRTPHPVLWPPVVPRPPSSISPPHSASTLSPTHVPSQTSPLVPAPGPSKAVMKRHLSPSTRRRNSHKSISLNQPSAAAALPVCPSHHTHPCAFFLPSVDDILRSPIRPSDIFTSIPGPCLPQVVLLFMKLVHRAANCTDPADTRNAFLRFHMFPKAVLRRSFRGEPGLAY